ncbi:MAG: hypothetical protein H7X97_06275 [Opitutaceae bacterium]|nr:hypothetical protein [Verrucomicrobiales bacterium]
MARITFDSKGFETIPRDGYSVPVGASNIQELSELLDTADLAALGPESRPGRWAAVKLNRRLDELFKGSRLDHGRQMLIRSLSLLWHDHLDASHEISQDIPDADGSYLHGIMHRREPDYGNAKYWFNRVGKHPAFPLLAGQVNGLQKEFSQGEPMVVFPTRGVWDPFLFIDACEQALTSGDEKRIHRMERIQQLEFQVLLEWFCGGDELS